MQPVESEPEPGQNRGDIWTFSALPSLVGVAVAVLPSRGPFPVLNYKFLLEEQLETVQLHESLHSEGSSGSVSSGETVLVGQYP